MLVVVNHILDRLQGLHEDVVHLLYQPVELPLAVIAFDEEAKIFEGQLIPMILVVILILDLQSNVGQVIFNVVWLKIIFWVVGNTEPAEGFPKLPNPDWLIVGHHHIKADVKFLMPDQHGVVYVTRDHVVLPAGVRVPVEQLVYVLDLTHLR